MIHQGSPFIQDLFARTECRIVPTAKCHCRNRKRPGLPVLERLRQRGDSMWHPRERCADDSGFGKERDAALRSVPVKVQSSDRPKQNDIRQREDEDGNKTLTHRSHSGSLPISGRSATASSTQIRPPALKRTTKDPADLPRQQETTSKGHEFGHSFG